MKKILTVCCTGGLMVILILCTIATVESAAAFVTAFPARKQLDHWRENQKQLEHARWEIIQSEIDHALQFTPDNPELLRDLGLAHEAEFILSPASDPQARRNREIAATYYQHAILLRPSWPYDRIAFLLAKYRLNAGDQDIYNLMMQASALGPWEPRVQQVVAEIGLRDWNRLPADVRKLTVETVNNGVRHPDNTKDILALLRRYNMPELVCNRQYEDELVERFCKQNYEGRE